MQPGFFGGGQGGAQGSAKALAGVAKAPTSQQTDAALAECLQLLKGPSDERRFVGLLLVTRLLPAGNEVAVRAVHEAVGPSFLSRLLLPLHTRTAAGASPLGPPPDAEQQQQMDAASCALGLAVLSSFARVPELAASEEMVQRLPLLLRVVRAGGLSQLLASPRPTASSASAAAVVAAAAAAADPAADAAAVEDALECVLAVAQSGPEGSTVALESHALSAAAQLLEQVPAGHARAALLAVQLVSTLLDGPQRTDVLSGNPSDTVQLVPALARVFALPADLTKPAADTAQQQQQQQQLAALQLEALQALLLVLPLPLPQAQVVHDGLQLSARHARWPAQLRGGLGLLLRGRIGAVQRHSALQLAAAAADLAGPDWVIGAAGEGGGSASSGRDPSGPAFFQLLVAVTKVETSVLLHDALAPSVPVPRTSHPAPAAGEWQSPAPRAAAPASDAGSEGEEVAEGAGEEEAEGQPGEGSADMQPLVRVLQSDADRRQLEEELQRDQAAAEAVLRPDHVKLVDETQIPTDMTWEGPSEAAGERAARVLPSCFALLEAAVEALAVDTQRVEEMEGGSRKAPQPPALSDAEAQQALASLHEASEVLLQFVEQTIGSAPGDGASPPILLAAVRAVGRFCAEVPEAFGPRLRAVLPQLLTLRSGNEGEDGGSGLPRDHPLWEDWMETQGSEPPVEGAVFLLPTLLQVTRPDWAVGGADEQRAEQREWLLALSQPEALGALVDYSRAAAAVCTKSVTAGVAEESDSQLLYACELLLNVLQPQLLPAVQLAPAQAAERTRLWRLTQEALPAVFPLLGLAPFRPVVPLEDATPELFVDHCRLLSIMAAVCTLLAAATVQHEQETQQQLTGAAFQQQRRQQQQPGRPGLLDSESLQRVCDLALASLHAAAQLLAGPQAAGAPPSGGAALRVTQAAAQAAAEDEPLQAELERNVDVLSTAALALLEGYPPFGAQCARHGWVQGALAAGLAQPGGGLPQLLSLQLFLRTCQAQQAQQQHQYLTA